MAAIEALVCRKGPDLANQMAQNVAVLLEPDTQKRLDAEEFVKDLYDARSRTLHGEFLEHESAMRRQARILASAVLKAFVERREHFKKLGVEAEKPDDLLHELRGLKYSGGEVPGIEPSPVRTLWRQPKSD